MTKQFLRGLLLASLLITGCGKGPEPEPLGPTRETPWGTLSGKSDTGKALALLYCSGCHVVDGQGHALMEAPAFEETVARNDVDATYLRTWIKTPNTLKPGTRMPTLGLDDSQIEHLIAYLYSLQLVE